MEATWRRVRGVAYPKIWGNFPQPSPSKLPSGGRGKLPYPPSCLRILSPALPLGREGWKRQLSPSKLPRNMGQLGGWGVRGGKATFPNPPSCLTPSPFGVGGVREGWGVRRRRGGKGTKNLILPANLLYIWTIYPVFK